MHKYPSSINLANAGNKIIKGEVAPYLRNMTLNSPMIKDVPSTKHKLVAKIERIFSKPFVDFKEIDDATNSRLLAKEVAERFGYEPWFADSGKQQGYKLPKF